MITNQYTPGPWRIERFESGDKEIVILEPAVSVDYDDVNRPEQEANARLIAAAPELLDALIRLLDGYVATINSGDCGQFDPEIDVAVIAARAAIAKATSHCKGHLSMTPIPKRPEYHPLFIAPDFTVEEVKHLEDMAAHEHAVAVRAIEALREMIEFTDSQMRDGDAARDSAREVLREVEASGWTP